MKDNNIVTSIKARDLAPDKYAVVVTYKDGARVGCLTTYSRLIEIIDDIEETNGDDQYAIE